VTVQSTCLVSFLCVGVGMTVQWTGYVLLCVCVGMTVQSIGFFVFLCICDSKFVFFQCVCMNVCLYVCLSVHVSVCLVQLTVCVCLCPCLTFCQSVLVCSWLSTA